MALADYLAKRYLTADSKIENRPKKRKRKDGTTSGLTIADDDALGWNHDHIGSTEDDAPLEGKKYVSFYHHLCLTLQFSTTSERKQRRVPQS